MNSRRSFAEMAQFIGMVALVLVVLWQLLVLLQIVYTIK